jgi:hypothetical protein
MRDEVATVGHPRAVGFGLVERELDLMKVATLQCKKCGYRPAARIARSRDDDSKEFESSRLCQTCLEDARVDRDIARQRAERAAMRRR